VDAFLYEDGKEKKKPYPKIGGKGLIFYAVERRGNPVHGSGRVLGSLILI
jgi:hypothetical protein